MSRPIHSVDEAGWAEFIARYGVGDVIDGQVVHVAPFGAFIRVGNGVDGLAPQASWPNLPEPGSRIAVRIVAIDADNRRVAFVPA
jgi:ribosomal protein S1